MEETTGCERRTRPATTQTARRERLAPGGFTYPEVIEPRSQAAYDALAPSSLLLVRTPVLSKPSKAGSPLGQVPALVLGLMGNPPY